ncbi:MAG: hypothetical protein MdMp014T_1890 [Treponematales bacterium]
MEEATEVLEQLELLIGRENALKVFELFSGTNIYFPKSLGLEELHNEIYERLRQGASYRSLALKYGYTEAWIRQIEHKVTRRERARRRAEMASAGTWESHAAHTSAAPPHEPFSLGELFDER